MSFWHRRQTFKIIVFRKENNAFSKDTLNKLEAMGHTIEIKRTMGSTQSIMKINETLYGASDPRTPSGVTLGY